MIGVCVKACQHISVAAHNNHVEQPMTPKNTWFSDGSSHGYVSDELPGKASKCAKGPLCLGCTSCQSRVAIFLWRVKLWDHLGEERTTSWMSFQTCSCTCAHSLLPWPWHSHWPPGPPRDDNASAPWTWHGGSAGCHRTNTSVRV